jgi:hypothetical protein
MNRETTRYATVQAQIEQLLDDAANDHDPVSALLRAQLVAELYARNEIAHAGQQARADLITALEWRATWLLAQSFVQWMHDKTQEA